MTTTTILSDNGVSSGSAGIKTTGGNDGTLQLQTTTSGGTATTALTIDTSQNVGIGTSSPTYQTQIYGTGQTTAALTDAGNKGGSLLLNTPTVYAGDGGALLLGAGGSGAKPFAAIKGLLADGGGNTTGSIAFSTRNATGDTALAERMRIDSSGNVGIGTASPGQKLTVAGTIESTSGGVKFPDGTTQTTAAAASAYVGGRGQVFTTVGSGQTFTIPTGVTAVKATVVGGGGGGGGAQGGWYSGLGGGGGGAAIKFLTGLTPGSTISVTVGAAGSAGGSNVNGGAGGTSSISSGTQTITTVSATGGTGGSKGPSVAYSAGAVGGVGSSGDLNIGGSAGQNLYPSNNGAGTCGGNSIYGGSGAGGANNVGGAGRAYGGGGGGGSYLVCGTAYGGGAGAQGVVIFEW